MGEPRRTLGTLAAAVGGTTALVALGRLVPGLAAPEHADLGSLLTWSHQVGVVVAVFALARLAAVAAGAYLSSVLVLAWVACVTRRARLGRLARALAPAPLRGWLAAAAGACMVATTLGLQAAEAAQPATGSVSRAGVTAPEAPLAPPPVLAPASPPATSGPAPPAPSGSYRPEEHGQPGRPRRRPGDLRSPRSPGGEWVVGPGESFWSIAGAVVGVERTDLGGPGLAVTASPANPDLSVVAAYWSELVAANRDRLPVPGAPDLLFVGDRLLLPRLPERAPPANCEQ